MFHYDKIMDIIHRGKKYKLTKESIVVDGKTLYRIEAVKSFGTVKRGEKGGFIEKEDNLSHDNICWVFDDACVYGNSKIKDEAYVYASAIVSDSLVGNSTFISENAKVVKSFLYGISSISGNSEVISSCLFDESSIYGNAHVDRCELHNYSRICGGINCF